MGILSGIFAAVKALAALLGLIQKAKDEKAGADAMTVAVDQKTIDAQKRMENAQNTGPHTGDDTVDELQHGKF